MSGVQAYATFQAIKLHFNSNTYDYFKYRGQLKSLHPDLIKARPDYVYFEKLDRNHGRHLEEYIAANYIKDPSISGPRGLDDRHYNEYLKYHDSFRYRFREEISRLDARRDFRVSEGQHPKALSLYISGKLDPQTVVALNAIMNLKDTWDKKITDEYVWPRISKHIAKMTPFIKFPREEIISIMKEEFDKRDDI